MRIYDLEQRKFITVSDEKITKKGFIGEITATIMYSDTADLVAGKDYVADNLIDIIPNEGYGVGLSKLPSGYYTEDDRAEVYFSEANLVAYDLENLRIYFKFDVHMLKNANLPAFFQVVGDSCELIFYKK